MTTEVKTEGQPYNNAERTVDELVEKMTRVGINALVADGMSREDAEKLEPWIKMKAVLYLLEQAEAAVAAQSDPTPDAAQ